MQRQENKIMASSNSAGDGTRQPDSILEKVSAYAATLTHDAISPAALHQGKVRVIDTLGALLAGFDGESAHMARQIASPPGRFGATIIGTDVRTSLEMAAFANAIAARSAEMMDVYHFPGSFGGHPSDVVMPVFATAECMRASGKDLITGVVLAYEIFLRFSDVFHNIGFDDTNFACISTAAVAARLLGLSPAQLANSIAIATVTGITLKQVRTDELTPWKVIATGQAGRSGIFSALLAAAGAPRPSLPFEGKAGWCAHVAREPITFGAFGGGNTPFKILDTRIKHRPAAGETISTIIAAEKIAPGLAGRSVDDIREVKVELYKRAFDRAGTGEHHWHPRSADAAGNSIPYIAAVTLREGRLTRQSFDQAHLDDADLSRLIQKVTLVENDEFTKAYAREPVEHRTRITVSTHNDESFVAESGGDEDDLSYEKTDAQIEAKFRSLAEPVLGPQRASAVLERLWRLETLPDVAPLASEFVIRRR